MKKSLVFLFGLLVLALNAANIDWQIKLDKSSTAKDARKASIDGKMPEGSKKVTTKGSNPVSLNRMSGKMYYGGTGFRGIACAKLTFDSDCTKMIGFGVNNFCTLFINGKQIATTEPGGNFHRPIHATNYVKNVQFKKGDNFVAMFIRPGAIGWDIAFDLIPDFSALPAEARTRTRLLNQLFPPKSEGLLSKECIYYTSADKVGITFETGLPTMAGIRYKKAGDKKAEIRWDSRDALKRNETIHRVELTGLKAATEYEYEVIVLDPRTAKVSALSKGKFTTFPETGTKTKFMVISDTQTDAGKRKAMPAKMLDMYGGRDTDFFVSLGDVSGGFANFRNEYFTTFYDSLPANKYFKPAFFVRGNHEFRGQDIARYNDFFGKSYYAFRHGDVFFIVLETGEDKATIHRPGHYTLGMDAEYYFVEQREWLRKVIETPECKNAKYRIVLAHAVPMHSVNGYFAKNIDIMIKEFFYGKNPKCKIDLWLAGHTHAPYLYDPATGKLHAADYNLSYNKKTKTNDKVPYTRNKPFVMNEQDKANVHFPIVVNDGPGGAGVYLSSLLVDVTPQNIRVKMFPVAETYTDSASKTVKPPILDVTLEKGKVTINSTTLKPL